MPKFSIITPTYNHDYTRLSAFKRCIQSVENQSHPSFEHIIVDQTEDQVIKKKTQELCEFSHSAIRYMDQPHAERLYALRKGFQEANGEWICLLDSDDIYLPHYLETIDKMIEENPDTMLFNFGSVHIFKDGRLATRDAFKPKREEVGHEIFGSGTIVNGTFVFNRRLWEELGDFPTTTDKLWNPWDFSEAAQEEFPELRAYFMVDHEDEPEKIVKELGNPWGQDFYLFYKYTRKYHSLPENKHLYVVYQK